MIGDGVKVEKRTWGRIRVSQPLKLRAAKDPNRSYKAVAIDVSEENIGIETDAKLVLGEHIQLELETESRVIVVQAVVKRIYDNRYGCNFAEDDYGKLFSIVVNKISYALGRVKIYAYLVLSCAWNLIFMCPKPEESG